MRRHMHHHRYRSDPRVILTTIPEEGQGEPDVKLKAWPNFSGVLLLVSGFTTALLGTVEIFPFPVTRNSTEVDFQYGLHYNNCFGATLFSGLLLLLNGTMTLRAVISKRKPALRSFFVVALFSLLTNTGFVGLQLYGAMHSWVPFLASKDECQDIPQLGETHGFALVHLLGVGFCVTGLMQLIVLVARYYDDVLFGEVKLLRSLTRCCRPCRCSCSKADVGQFEGQRGNCYSASWHLDGGPVTRRDSYIMAIRNDDIEGQSSSEAVDNDEVGESEASPNDGAPEASPEDGAQEASPEDRAPDVTVIEDNNEVQPSSSDSSVSLSSVSETELGSCKTLKRKYKRRTSNV